MSKTKELFNELHSDAYYDYVIRMHQFNQDILYERRNMETSKGEDRFSKP